MHDLNIDDPFLKQKQKIIHKYMYREDNMYIFAITIIKIVANTLSHALTYINESNVCTHIHSFIHHNKKT